VVAPGNSVPAENPETLNPVPEAVAWEIVVLTPPVFVRVMIWLEVCPVVMFVNARLAGDGVTTAGKAGEPPAPEYESTTALFTPLTVSITAPSVAGIAAGEKVTPNVIDWFGARVAGRSKLLTPKPAPITVDWEIVTLLVSEFVSVSISVTVVPIATVPKEYPSGLAVRAGGVAPDPVSGILNTLLVPVFVSDTLPVAAAITDGG